MIMNSTIFNSLLKKYCVKKASIFTLKWTDNFCMNTKIDWLNMY